LLRIEAAMKKSSGSGKQPSPQIQTAP
jgi:hypothetical protein